jgi:NADH-quinone oxidoreductase subunit N
VLLGVLMSVAAAFFYLRVIVYMYMRDPAGEQDEDPSIMPRVALVIPAVLTLALGVFPGIVVGFIEKASVLRW